MELQFGQNFDYIGLKKLTDEEIQELERQAELLDEKEYIGKRVKFLRSSDPYTKLVYGDEGIVESVDALGTVHIKWDNGSNLGMITEEGDRFQFVK